MHTPSRITAYAYVDGVIIIFIFLTIKDRPMDESRGLSKGVADYLSKDVLTAERNDILRYRLRNFFAMQENERLRGVLATVVSANHKINNPLMVIQGSLDLLRMRGVADGNAEMGELLDRACTATLQIRDVLHRIATLSTWETRPYLDGVEMLDLGTEEVAEGNG